MWNIGSCVSSTIKEHTWNGNLCSFRWVSSLLWYRLLISSVLLQKTYSHIQNMDYSPITPLHQSDVITHTSTKWGNVLMLFSFVCFCLKCIRDGSSRWQYYVNMQSFSEIQRRRSKNERDSELCVSSIPASLSTGVQLNRPWFNTQWVHLSKFNLIT